MKSIENSNYVVNKETFFLISVKQVIAFLEM